MTCELNLKIELQVDDADPVTIEINRCSPFSHIDWKEELDKKGDLRKVALMMLMLDLKVLNQEPVPAALRKEE